jgi:hypothetical protein
LPLLGAGRRSGGPGGRPPGLALYSSRTSRSAGAAARGPARHRGAGRKVPGW